MGGDGLVFLLSFAFKAKRLGVGCLIEVNLNPRNMV